MRSGTLTGCLLSISTWNRTRTRTLGQICAIRYTIEMWNRRLDSHQRLASEQESGNPGDFENRRDALVSLAPPVGLEPTT